MPTQWDQTDLPSLRVRSLAANTLTNASLQWDLDGVEPSSCPYKEPALTIELPLTPNHVIAIGAGGIRTPAGRVKSSLCCRYTTTPCEGVATFVCQVEFHDDLLQSRVESTNSGLMGMSPE